MFFQTQIACRLSKLTLMFKLVRARDQTSSMWIWCKSIQWFRRYLPKPLFIPGDLDLWPWHSNLSKQGIKHVFPLNLEQIRSAVPEIFHTQTKKQELKMFLPNTDHMQAAKITARLQDLAHWHTTIFSLINLHIPHTNLSFSSRSFHTATPNSLSHVIYSSIRSTPPWIHSQNISKPICFNMLVTISTA